MQTETETVYVPPLPNEIILQILSYLVADMDSLRKPWSRVCRLFRGVMEKQLEEYCQGNGFNYKTLRNHYHRLLSKQKKGILPLLDFIECAITRQTIHKMGRYNVFKNATIYPYIPSAICEVGYLNESRLPTKDTVHMAMIIGNVRLCLFLLEDVRLREYAKDFMQSILKGKGTRFSLQFELNPYSAALPWEILNRGLSRAFLACYERLSKEEDLGNLPSRQNVIKELLAHKEFILVEECIKHWSINVAIPFAADLLFNSPYSHKRTITLQHWYKQLSTDLGEFNCATIAQVFHDSFLKQGPFYVSWYDANRLLLQLKEKPLFSEVLNKHGYTKQQLNKKEVWIQLEHIFSKDFEYINFLLKQGMQVSAKTLLTAVESLDVCIPSTKKMIFPNIQRILESHADYLEIPILKEALWNRAINSGYLPIVKRMMELIPLDNLDINKRVLSALESEPTSTLSVLKLYDSPCMLQAIKDHAIQYGKASMIHHLLKAGIDDWSMDWQATVNIFLEKDDYKTEGAFHLFQYLLEVDLIEASIDLLHAICNYTKRLLHFVYEECHYTVSVNLADIVRFQWSILDRLMRQSEKSIHTEMELSSQLQKSIVLCGLHNDPAQCTHLVSMMFCNTFRLKVLELAEEFFIQKRYSSLFEQLEKTNDTQHEVTKLLALLSKKWWRSLLSRHSGERVCFYVKAACHLILKYQIKDLEIIQNCFEIVKNSFQWDFVKPIMVWKIKIHGCAKEDQLALEACFDKNGYLLGPIGNQEVIDWKNELCGPQGVGKVFAKQ